MTRRTYSTIIRDKGDKQLVWQGFISLSLANISYIKDVTQYKQGEKALLEAESLYLTIFEIAGTAMSVIQTDGTTFGGKSRL